MKTTHQIGSGRPQFELPGGKFINVTNDRLTPITGANRPLMPDYFREDGEFGEGAFIVSPECRS